MSGFIYYLANRTALTAGEIKSLSMAYAFDKDESVSYRTVARGPDNGQGILFGSEEHVTVPQLTFQPEKQTWMKYGDYWVGYLNDYQPSPSELIRKDVLPGQALELGDGKAWMIPVARRWSMNESSYAMEWDTDIPRRLKLSEAGSVLYGDVIERYRGLWSIANAVFNTRRDGLTADEYISTEAERDLLKDGTLQVMCAVKVLQANYKVSGVECLNLLGLFESDTTRDIFNILIDWENYLSVAAEYVQKKRELAVGQPSLSGQEAD